MTDASTYVDAEGIARRDLLKRGAIGGGLVVAALATPALTGKAEAKGGKAINLHIGLTDTFIQIETATDSGLGPFYIGGDIFTQAPTPSGNPYVAGDLIGVFQCWGFIAEGVGVVNQEFKLTDRGKIIIAGIESDEVRAVTGGTGDFSAARGEGVPDITFFDSDGLFRIDFSLTGAAGASIV